MKNFEKISSKKSKRDFNNKSKSHKGHPKSKRDAFWNTMMEDYSSCDTYNDVSKNKKC